MRKTKSAGGTRTLVGIVGVAIWLAWPAEGVAHCDTLDGPVVMEAKAALEKGDVTPVLKWVKEDSEQEVRAAFEKALAVRSGGPDAMELADGYFFETLVRLHRAGEGSPYTGLKPAGTIEPSVAAADRAIEDGSVDELAGKIAQAAEEAIRERFARLMEARAHKDESVEAGRRYVEAYVIYVHFVEGLHNTIARGGPHEAHAGEKADHVHGR